MTRMLARVPLIVALAGILSATMYIPAFHASALDFHVTARAFFYAGTIFLALTAAIGLATARYETDNPTRSNLLALLGVFTLLPVIAAVPLGEIVRDASFLDLYVEMVAAMTTTGGSLFDPRLLPDSVHLWRAMVAWQGGLLIWIAAAAILAPLRLGGFEVSGDVGPQGDGPPGRSEVTTPQARVARAATLLVPIYFGLTLALWMMLVGAGQPATTAVIHAMSTLSTSGITNDTDFVEAGAGVPGEILIALFLVFALSRRTFSPEIGRERFRLLAQDRELWVAGMIIGSVTVFLFVRHWIGAFDEDRLTDTRAALGALWGSAFTVLSFLTTTGFESTYWDDAQNWSGFTTPSVLLLGLAVFGGGVATTAGGAKLLRIYALYTHGRREMAILVHPSSVANKRRGGVRFPRGGINAAWVFFMLFATSLAVATLALALAGLGFAEALTLAVASLTTTGPLADIAIGGRAAVYVVPDAAKLVAAAVMVVGRLESLALIALLNPDFWRD
ncbi:Trk system potassium uptake protein TrkG [Jannaschia seosinensis]|uniref:Trk system potassium uptake protein TrkG n=1 Tax=Jannaschia seosinensis TaxID=313367 RepID=A0A0M7BCH7_9RHOB|nr:potassium transporter TrkG [Jannaschia seosinensis]CUH40440.1 Trk system potassium uptake protein TrkG [Jannaschia seosinensis]